MNSHPLGIEEPVFGTKTGVGQEDQPGDGCQHRSAKHQLNFLLKDTSGGRQHRSILAFFRFSTQSEIFRWIWVDRAGPGNYCKEQAPRPPGRERMMKTALHSVSYAGVWPGQAKLSVES